MESELTKVRDLLDMGFIQPQEAEERMAEIRQRFGASAEPSSSASSQPSTSHISSSYPTSYESPQTYSYSPPPAQEPTPSTLTYSNSYESPQEYSYSAPPPQEPSQGPTTSSYNPGASYQSQAPVTSSDIRGAGFAQTSASGLEWDISVTVRSAELTLENNNLTVVNRGKATGSYNIARAKTGYSSGRHSWSIRVDSVPAGQGWVFAIGVTRGDVNKSMYVGGGGNGWAYLSNGQKLFSNAFLKYETKGFGAGDVIGVTVDFDASDLRFSRNGEDLGVAFKGISGFVYPAVTVPGPDKGPLSKQFGSLTLL